MLHRNPTKVAIMTVLTLSIYELIWLAKTRDELNEKLNNKSIPTLLWFLVPLGIFWWAWLYSETAEKATGGKITRNDTFLLFLVSTISGGSTTKFFVKNSSSIGNSSMILIFAIIGFIASSLIFSIFPYILQKRFNNLPDQK